MSVLSTGLAKTSAGGYDIDNSLRFNDDDSAYLSKVWGVVPTDANKFTYSVWVKRGNLDSSAGQHWLLGATLGAESNIKLSYDNIRVHLTGSNYDFDTSQLFRDSSAWYHLLFIYDSDDVTASDRFKIYVNGVRVTDFSTSSTIPSGTDNEFTKNGVTATIGAYDGSNHIFDGHLAEVHFIDGQALDHTSFGETGDYGEWKPIEYAGTYGTNGFYLDFSNSGSLGTDASSNTNNWTVNNLAATDQMLDTPTNNFCTLNPWRNAGSTMTIAEGNLHFNAPYGNPQGAHGSTMTMTTGKWYWEVYINSISGANSGGWIGIRKNATDNDFPYDSSDGYLYRPDNGYKCVATTQSSYGASLSNDNILAFTYDADIGTLTAYVNNSTQGSLATGLSGSFEMAVCDGNSDAQNNVIFNFGQDSSFAGNKTAQGNQDSNSIGDFYYTPPTDFLALCTSNLPDPAVIPSEHFNTVLYTGNEATNAITGTGFQPDFVWIKDRGTLNTTYNYGHALYDSMRGALKHLRSNTTAAEGNQSDSLTSFDTDGFTVGSHVGQNELNEGFVSWNWKAGGADVLNENGTIDSQVSANVDAGFSIVSYTGNGVNGATFGHGLSSKPDLVIIKNRDDGTRNWMVQVGSEGYGGALFLQGTNSFTASTLYWNSTSPTTSLVTVGTHTATNASAQNLIAYCFHSVEGYSKVGSYTGNSSADGTFVHCGFRPAYVMVKDTENSSWPWWIHDTARNPINPSTKQLRPNSSAAEYDDATYTALDIVSNGFKWRTSEAQVNANGETFIYIAFAENPFKYTNAR